MLMKEVKTSDHNATETKAEATIIYIYKFIKINIIYI